MGASSTIGKQISWGVPDGVRDDVLTHLTAGTIAGFDVSEGGDKDVHTDEDNKKVGATYSGDEAQVNIEVECMATTTKPSRGDELTGLIGADTGLLTGKVLVDSCKVAWKKGEKKMLSIQATHYPDMED